MKNIGVNFKFKKSNSFDDDILVSYIKRYNLYSNVLQLKFDLNNIYIDRIISLIKEHFYGEFYIHIRDNDFLNLINFDEFLVYGNNNNFIVHINSDFTCDKCLDKVEMIKTKIGKSCVLFENDDNCDFESILFELGLFFEISKCDNFKICLDIAHLFKNKTFDYQDKIITQLLDNNNIINKIELFHLHGYNNNKDHLSLRDDSCSSIDYKSISKLVNSVGKPIILEVGLNDNLDYIYEIEYLNKFLSCDK